MAVDTFRVITLGFKITGGHPRNLSQRPQIVLGDVVIVIVRAAEVGACVCTIQVEDVAQLELLDAFDVFVGYRVVHVIDSLA